MVGPPYALISKHRITLNHNIMGWIIVGHTPGGDTKICRSRNDIFHISREGGILDKEYWEVYEHIDK